VGVAIAGDVARTRLPVPVTVQLAVVGAAEPPLLLQRAALLEIEARLIVPLAVMGFEAVAVNPLAAVILVTVPVPLTVIHCNRWQVAGGEPAVVGQVVVPESESTCPVVAFVVGSTSVTLADAQASAQARA